MFREQRLRHVADPIANTERTELGKISIIENQNEMRGFIAETFKHVGVAARKVPNIARIKIVRFGLSCRVNYCRAGTASDDKSPLRRCRMPMKFAHYSGLPLHCHAGDPFGTRQ